MMIPTEASQIVEGLHCLGPPPVPVYLLDCKKPALFDAGMAILSGHYLQEIKQILKDRPLQYLFLTHMHFDHCGAAGHLKEEYPDLKICASKLGANIITRPSAIDLISKLNRFPGMVAASSFKKFEVDIVLNDAQQIELDDGINVSVIAAPGHTRDLFAFYLRHNRTLIPSEAIGVMTKEGYVFSEFLVDYESYITSIRKLSTFNADKLLMAHDYIITGDDARSFFSLAEDQAEKFKNKIISLLKEFNNNKFKVATTIKKEEYDHLMDPKQPEEAYKLNLDAKIAAIEKLLGS